MNFKTYSKSNKLKKGSRILPKSDWFSRTHTKQSSAESCSIRCKSISKAGSVPMYRARWTSLLATCSVRNAVLGCICTGERPSIQRQTNFQCGGYQTKGNTHCTSHYIRESVLNEIVLTSLRQMTAYARENTDEFYAMATTNGEAEAERFYATAERQKRRLPQESVSLTTLSVACMRIG